MKINNCKLQIGTIKLIHPINLTNVEITVNSINKFVSNRVDDKLELYSIIKEKCKKLHNNFEQIKPTKRTRHRRWDVLGSAWKWVAGNPDAQDLRIINSTMNALIEENNQQFRVNKEINERIQLITDTVNRAITTTTMANKIILTELEMLTTIINIDIVNTILEDIQEAIIRTKVELPSNRILSLKEITLIKDLLIDQGINITLPDEALQYVIPKIAVNNETLLYILEIPKLQDEISETLMVLPLTVNNTIIRNHPHYLIKSNRELFSTFNQQKFVQKHSEIKVFEDDCIKPLIMGTASHCNVSSKTEATMHLIAEDKLLIDNVNNWTLSTDCGPNNRTLTGNFLITFWNCTMEIDNKKFQSYEIKSETQEIQGALHNLQTTRRLIKDIDIESINQQNIQNRNEISHVYLKQTGYQYWIWTLSGGVSLSSLGILALFIYIGSQIRITKTIVKDSNQSCSRKETKDESATGINKLIKLHKETKDVDALPSPPGGVIIS